ncbi:MAG: AAA family ATPase [Verrucomicrobia bacterium]|nr:AAA family ATPase [Verrucomicrobiota bacterium]MBU4291093.1 AAA family ATPase [Verrucomicrobiota bacterium]MBU4429357.1 AAA family ATPase [Verrucomicrobiota bacterium]MBU4498130.1 AAA family ATPase [Verrucomicrobiota bacterium]MCG2680110.1 AAA family ATPase [Kiritimatiellia bacterium]
MYEEYWKLNNRPFHNTPDPKFFYHSVQHDEALMKLTYAVTENMGAALLTGAYGCGKTLLSRVLLQQLGKSNVSKSCIAQPGMAPLDLLRSIARAMTETPLSADRSNLVADAMLEIIEKALQENRRDGKHTVLIIDEAHMLDNEAVLEMLRLLLNVQSHDEFLLTLLFLGHLELAERVAGLKQFAQRIPITCTLHHFDSADTARYIQSRLAVAGRADPLFQEEALNLIHRNSGGIPRRINTLCDVSLALGYAQKSGRIDTNLVLEAAEKFGVV